MLDDISNRAGTYLLIFYSAKSFSVRVGRLGSLELDTGYYYYVGSALGPGGVRASVRHHYAISTKPHWHLDYIRPSLCLKEVWYSIDARRYEHEWASILRDDLHMLVPFPGLGASDCQCGSHFFYTRLQVEPLSIRNALKMGNENLNLRILEKI